MEKVVISGTLRIGCPFIVALDMVALTGCTGGCRLSVR
jgi:hypothetical protein